MGDVSQQLEGLTSQQGEILRKMEALNTELAEAKDERYDEVKAQLKGLADDMATVTAERKAAEREAEIKR